MSGREAESRSWSRLPAFRSNAFGYVPTPALVAPIEFSLKKEDYAALGGHMDTSGPLSELAAKSDRTRPSRTARSRAPPATYTHRKDRPWREPRVLRYLPGGRRLHFHDGPIDLILKAFGAPAEIEAAYRAAAKRFVTVLDELCSEAPLLSLARPRAQIARARKAA